MTTAGGSGAGGAPDLKRGADPTPGPATPEPATPEPEATRAEYDAPWLRVALKVGGTLVGVLAGFVTGVWEVFLSPLYAGRTPLPVSPVLAVVTTVAIIWFTRRVTGSMGLSLLPGVVWFGTMLIAATKTTEGDLPMPSTDWMGLLTILVGALAWGIYAYRMIVSTRPELAPSARSASTRPSRGAVPAQPTPSAKPTPPGKPTPSTRPPAAKPAPGAKPAGGKGGAAGRNPGGRGRPAGGNRSGRAN